MDETPEVLTRAQEDAIATRGVIEAELPAGAVRRDISGALDRAQRYLEICRRVFFSGAVTPALVTRIVTSASQIENMLYELRSSLAGGGDDISPNGFVVDNYISSCGEDLVSEMNRIIEADGPPPEDDPPSTLDHLLSQEVEDLNFLLSERAQVDRERSYMADIERLRATAADAAEEATRLAEVTAKAAGVSGIAGEAEALSIYAKKQLQAAEFFRWFAASLIALTLLAAIVVPHPASDDVAGAIYRLAIIAGAAGLATYFGRQAGMHRRNGNWASALLVQLKTFPALAESIRDEELKGRLFESFAQRLLLSAPEHGKPTSDETASVQSLLEAILKRLPASGS
ncbi:MULTISPECIES: hypothetical protein [unclassified Microbacterium]|uniref:hypothetical protein n=1 Tax=unclassified Microbacterium TaxID=2609290 RepID=UPI003C2B6A7F